jgi:hypothetical protein
LAFISVTAKTYRYLEEDEQPAEGEAAGSDKPKGKQKAKQKGNKPAGKD